MTDLAASWTSLASNTWGSLETSSWSALENVVEAWRRRFRSTASHTSSVSSREVLPVYSAQASDILPRWVTSALSRVAELSRLPAGWDSYNARPMQAAVTRDFFLILLGLSHAIQSEPTTSLTSEGGLVASWENESGSLDLIVDPLETPRVVYSNGLDESEWYGPVDASSRIEKWLWHTSAVRSEERMV